MLVTPAYAQSMGGGTPDIFMTVVPFVLIFVVMYFLIIRPQRQQLKKRGETERLRGHPHPENPGLARNDQIRSGGECKPDRDDTE